ncbi:hypothetical protein LWI28_011971 [Acer negundo]|uniref:Uncharacterized protein n=1 Tax=Acer negundo TaxID=4023 RepID=A0AAD5IA58_ACENE|nr:hypothetical protein LWI28_011971 [Acer negundo]KAK4835564.1 hypothetical protein QYF36_011409 [Acer negundo]
MLKRSLILNAELRDWSGRFPIPTMKHLSLNTQYVCNGAINAYIQVMSSCHYDLYGRASLVAVFLSRECSQEILPSLYTIIIDIREPNCAANISGIMKSGN